MCGIAGIVTLAGQAPPAGLVGAMRDRLLHRGPDGAGEFEAPGVALAACRLAIVDPNPGGRMPMATPDGRFHLVFNGQIYNRPALQHDLRGRGVTLRTDTDTEVVLHLFATDGMAMLDRLDGMFAFAIWDTHRRELFAARDRCGEKPLFYAVADGRLVFASEPKALFVAGVPCGFDAATWTELLVFRHVAGTRTPYRGVVRLAPGGWLRTGTEGLTTGTWWRFPVVRDAHGQGHELGSLLEASVTRRLVADVPVGTLLSGGIDSSAVTALAAAQHGPGLPAFTASYADPRTDEGPFARAVARTTGVVHHEIRPAPDEMASLLADAAWHQDEPMAFVVGPDLLAVSRHARRHVRVLLTGEGSDELFAGYQNLRRYLQPRVLRMAGWALRPLSPWLPAQGRLRRAIRTSRLTLAAWIGLAGADRDPALFTSAPLAEWAPARAAMGAAALAQDAEPLRAALTVERQTHLQAVLDHCDRQTMAAGIEARVPFLDPRLLTLAAALPTRALFDRHGGKRPLREAMVGRLPERVRLRAKRGWLSPYGDYLRTVPNLRDWIARMPDHEIVATSPPGRSGTRTLVDRWLGGDVRSGQLVWLLGRVVLWHQRCVEGRTDPFAGSV